MLWIAEESNRIKSPHSSRGLRDVEALVFHWTASPNRGGADRPRVERWLSGKGKKSSTHFVILRDGTLLQGVPLDRKAWHAGRSRLPMPYGRSLNACNNFTIGIDFENVGPLTHKGGGRWVDCYGGEYNGGKPKQKHEPYTDAQVKTAIALCATLGELFPIIRKDVEFRVVGHSDVSPGRKIDPGPLCPFDELREAVMGL